MKLLVRFFVVMAVVSGSLGEALLLPARGAETPTPPLADTRGAAEQGDATAQFSIGFAYRFGLGVAQDYAEAVKWFRRAAEQGYAISQWKLGNMYNHGRGVSQDDAEAVRWYRKAAEQGFAEAQVNLGVMYSGGRGVSQDDAEAVRWSLKAANQGCASAQFNLGVMHQFGHGALLDHVKAVKWYRRAAEQGLSSAQFNLGVMYRHGRGVSQDNAEATRWYRRAANQGCASAQFNLGVMYGTGQGFPQNDVEAYVWFSLAAAQGNEEARNYRDIVARRMSRQEVVLGQQRASAFVVRKESHVSHTDEPLLTSTPAAGLTAPKSSGTGFFITEDGYLLTSFHVVEEASHIQVLTRTGILSAIVIRSDAANDAALLKVSAVSEALPIVSSRGVALGSTVATVGFPNIGLQGFQPKMARGEIAGLSGARDDPRYFQVSLPVQPGNSGGALVNELGNVIGIVAAKLSVEASLAMTGTFPENVNYAVKSSYLLSFLESVPGVVDKMKAASTRVRQFEDVVKATEEATVLVLVY